MFLFLLFDVACSYVLAMTVIFIARWVLYGISDPLSMVPEWVLVSPVLDEYLQKSGAKLYLDDVIVPSSILTSAWTFLFIISLIVVVFLSPLDKLRQFTLFWFRDVEKRPLTAIAKVAGTLVILAAVLIKGARWFLA